MTEKTDRQRVEELCPECECVQHPRNNKWYFRTMPKAGWMIREAESEDDAFTKAYKQLTKSGQRFMRMRHIKRPREEKIRSLYD